MVTAAHSRYSPPGSGGGQGVVDPQARVADRLLSGGRGPYSR